MGLYKKWILDHLDLFTNEEIIEWGLAETDDDVKELRKAFSDCKN